LVQDSNGVFYGTTQGGGGTNGFGTVFKFTLQTNSSTSIVCVLSPSLATNVVGTKYSVTATISSNNIPRVGASVTFIVDSGPNKGQSLLATTDASGQATFSFTGSISAGTDALHATSLGAIGYATNVWIAPDSVGDGISDAWRARYFGGNGTTTNNQSCAACDADGTGQNNHFKYVAGLDPTNPASVFAITVQSVSGQPKQKKIIYNPVVNGRTYTLQFGTNLVGTWAPLTGFGGPTINSNNQATITDRNASQASKLYRLKISLP
jgi:uncharacterized repeat protein (TIGR03803 family)